MDPTATPWRVLEEGPSRSQPETGDPAAAGTFPRSMVFAGVGVIALSALAFFLAVGSGSAGSVLVEGTLPAARGSTEPGIGGEPSSEPELIVEIVGAVLRPGVFHVPVGARIGDLVDAAGGYSARIDAGRATRELNLAARLQDGDQVRVPSRDDVETAPVDTGGAGAPHGGSAAGGPVDLNRATAAELEALPGIGPVTATKILSARDEAPFSTVDELRTRKLVGEKTFEKLKDLVTVR